MELMYDPAKAGLAGQWTWHNVTYDRNTLTVSNVFPTTEPVRLTYIGGLATLPPGLAAAIVGVLLAESVRSKRKSRESGWIEIELLDEVGEPVPGEKYRVTLPDGSVREGTLDAVGRARLEGHAPGTCQVSFPKLDASLWRRAEGPVDA
jgi:hypothetical protein